MTNKIVFGQTSESDFVCICIQSWKIYLLWFKVFSSYELEWKWWRLEGGRAQNSCQTSQYIALQLTDSIKEKTAKTHCTMVKLWKQGTRVFTVGPQLSLCIFFTDGFSHTDIFTKLWGLTVLLVVQYFWNLILPSDGQLYRLDSFRFSPNYHFNLILETWQLW